MVKVSYQFLMDRKREIESTIQGFKDRKEKLIEGAHVLWLEDRLLNTEKNQERLEMSKKEVILLSEQLRRKEMELTEIDRLIGIFGDSEHEKLDREWEEIISKWL